MNTVPIYKVRLIDADHPETIYEDDLHLPGIPSTPDFVMVRHGDEVTAYMVINNTYYAEPTEQREGKWSPTAVSSVRKVETRKVPLDKD